MRSMRLKSGDITGQRYSCWLTVPTSVHPSPASAALTHAWTDGWYRKYEPDRFKPSAGQAAATVNRQRRWVAEPGFR